MQTCRADRREPDLSLGLGAEGLLRRSQQDKPKIWERGFWKEGLEVAESESSPLGGGGSAVLALASHSTDH